MPYNDSRQFVPGSPDIEESYPQPPIEIIEERPTTDVEPPPANGEGCPPLPPIPEQRPWSIFPTTSEPQDPDSDPGSLPN